MSGRKAATKSVKSVEKTPSPKGIKDYFKTTNSVIKAKEDTDDVKKETNLKDKIKEQNGTADKITTKAAEMADKKVSVVSGCIFISLAFSNLCYSSYANEVRFVCNFSICILTSTINLHSHVSGVHIFAKLLCAE